jgi:hypothetical protein
LICRCSNIASSSTVVKVEWDAALTSEGGQCLVYQGGCPFWFVGTRKYMAGTQCNDQREGTEPRNFGPRFR